MPLQFSVFIRLMIQTNHARAAIEKNVAVRCLLFPPAIGLGRAHEPKEISI